MYSLLTPTQQVRTNFGKDSDKLKLQSQDHQKEVNFEGCLLPFSSKSLSSYLYGNLDFKISIYLVPLTSHDHLRALNFQNSSLAEDCFIVPGKR
jgi:hypothetical protein